MLRLIFLLQIIFILGSCSSTTKSKLLRLPAAEKRIVKTTSIIIKLVSDMSDNYSIAAYDVIKNPERPIMSCEVDSYSEGTRILRNIRYQIKGSKRLTIKIGEFTDCQNSVLVLD